MNPKSNARIALETCELMLALFGILFGLICSWLHLAIGAYKLNLDSLSDKLGLAAVAAFIVVVTIWVFPTLKRLARCVMDISDAPFRIKERRGMRTMADIRAANPNAGKDPFPIFKNFPEHDEPQGDYDDEEMFAEIVDMLIKYLPKEKS